MGAVAEIRPVAGAKNGRVREIENIHHGWRGRPRIGKPLRDLARMTKLRGDRRITPLRQRCGVFFGGDGLSFQFSQFVYFSPTWPADFGIAQWFLVRISWPISGLFVGPITVSLDTGSRAGDQKPLIGGATGRAHGGTDCPHGWSEAAIHIHVLPIWPCTRRDCRGFPPEAILPFGQHNTTPF
jgi:hypothetical protein